jgi:hypothetical protein
MKKGYILLLGVVLSLGFAISVQAKSGDVVFKNSGYIYNGSTTTVCGDAGIQKSLNAEDLSSCVNLGDVRIFLVSTHASCWLTNGNKACKFEDVQPGRKLFRFEWKSDIGRPAQVVDAWIDIPDWAEWNMTYVYDVPAHNVVFTSDVGNRDIGMMSQGIVGDRRELSIINNWSDEVILLKGNLSGGDYKTNVPMLDGCYTVYYYADNTCPGSGPSSGCDRNYLDYPLCVGGAPDAANEVHLENDDNPTLFE